MPVTQISVERFRVTCSKPFEEVLAEDLQRNRACAVPSELVPYRLQFCYRWQMDWQVP
jgi:hypothetical protein